MGFISELARSHKGSFSGQSQGRESWDRIFATDKETTKPHSRYMPEPGGSYGRSVTSTDASVKRLLQALRSMAPGGWSDDRYAQEKSYTGITYVAIHGIGQQLSQSEFQVFDKDPTNPDGKVPTKTKGGEDLIRLLEKPNDDDSFGDLMEQWNLQMDLTGMALTWKVPNALGTPMELYPIPTSIAIPQPAINPDYPDGFWRIQPVYPYGPFSSYPTPTTSVGAPIPAQWMMRFKYPHPILRYDGYSPQTALSLHIDEVTAMDRSRWYKMKRSFNPNMVLNMTEVEGVQTNNDAEIERIRAQLEDLFMGVENNGGLIVPPPGGKLEEFGTSPREMDYHNSWEQLVSFVMGGYGITKPAAGMIEDSSYSTLFATLKQLYWLTLDPKVNRIAAKLTRHLAPHFGDNLIVEIRCKRIDDHDVKFTKMDKLIQANAITVNELRREMDMPLTQEEWGEERVGLPTPPGQEMMEEPMMEEQNPDTEATGGAVQELQNVMDGQEEKEIENERPRSGMNEGALGPMKLPKSLYQAARLNGFHKNGTNNNGRHEKCLR